MGEKGNVFSLSFLHHAWSVLHLQFFRPCEEGKNIQNCVRLKKCCCTKAFSFVTGIFPNNDTAMITKHVREALGGGGALLNRNYVETVFTTERDGGRGRKIVKRLKLRVTKEI
jgi:hypothetical protein